MNRKKFLDGLWIILICVICFFIGWMANDRFGSADSTVQTALELIIDESFYNQQSNIELSNAAIRGMISVIDDPYAELIEPEAAQDLVDAFRGNTGVVGLYAENQAGKVVILKVFPDSPASEAGIRVGDFIQSVDGIMLDAEADSSETGLLIRGTPGTPVKLEILRDGELLEFTLIRQEQEFVSSKMLPDQIAWISLSAFNENSAKRFKEALEGLLDQNPIGLIWDLRNNEGGDMQAAQEILSYFIEDGLLFSAELTRDRIVQFSAKGDVIAGEIPLVVLIDGSTYSAAETAAAAIVELGRGTTVGSDSYGKGVIQATMPLKDNALMQMTIAKWLSANGEWYHERGVPAQIVVKDDPETEVDEVLQAAIEALIEQK